MNNDKDTKYNDGNVADILHIGPTSPPQLTPTGKISHAKTRVYTQRYRKAWEQMPDFKGWLTSVPHQPTRAFCTYCRKNLHAHRLSLLKHTCTMKHQRGALMHQKESKSQADQPVDQKLEEITKSQIHDENEENNDEDNDFKLEDEDAEDDVDDNFEYVVERLETDEIGDDEQSKDVDDEDYAETADDDDHLSVRKKMKIEDNANRPDTLAEAMAHVHGEYLDENGESVNVELDMVVEPVETDAQEMRIVSVVSEAEDVNEHQEITIESYENDENSTDYAQANEKETDQELNQTLDNAGTTASSCKSSVIGESSDEIDETDQLASRNLQTISSRKNYLTKPSTARSISILPTSSTGSNGPTVIPKSKKTITLTSCGKTVTINTSSITNYPGGSQRLLKGNRALSSDIKISQHQPIPITVSTPGTSQAVSRKQIILKPVKSVVVRKPFISAHVLDTSKGVPVGGLQISLYKLMDGRWTFINESNTTADGRCADLIDPSKYTFTAGRYKLHFDIDKYFTLRRIETMYPFIEIIFDVKNPTEHYHIPILISPFGYTTYRGS